MKKIIYMVWVLVITVPAMSQAVDTATNTEPGSLTDSLVPAEPTGKLPEKAFAPGMDRRSDAEVWAEMDSLVACRVAANCRDSFDLSDSETNRIYQLVRASRAQKRIIRARSYPGPERNEAFRQEDIQLDIKIYEMLGTEKYTRFKQKRWQLMSTN